MPRIGSFLSRWGFVLVWATLPLTAGPAFAEALDARISAARTLVSACLWVGWAVVLAGSLVPRTTSLTLVRVLTPVGVLGAAWATVVGPGRGAIHAMALTFTLAATILVLASFTGDVFVNGSSYGEEHRFLLRPPGVLLFGPIELTWLAVVAGMCVGPLLLADRLWMAGGPALVVGWGVAFIGVRALHVLAQRWVVFVPQGLVVVDRSTLADSFMVPRSVVASLHLAPKEPNGSDLTAGALGPALELELREPNDIVVLPPRHLRGPQTSPKVEKTEVVRFCPSRPGPVLDAAGARRIPVR